MKKYNIKVNGTAYEVEVEEAEGIVNPTISPVEKLAVTAPVSTPAPATPKAKPAVSVAPIASGAQTVKAPMPGTLLDIRVTQGQKVKAGDILVILEAMKMENEILAPVDGTVDTVQATKGESVNANDILVTIK